MRALVQSFRGKFGGDLTAPGSIDFLEAQSDWRAGPSTVREAFAWPYTQLRQIEMQPGALQRLCQNFQRGVTLTSHYSGILCFDVAAKFVETAVKSKHLPLLQDGRPPAEHHLPFVRSQSACDIDGICQQLVGGMPATMRPQHYLRDLNDLLVPDVRSLFDAWEKQAAEQARRALSTTETDIMTDVYLRMACHLFANLETVFAATAPCALHAQCCPSGCISRGLQEDEALTVESAGSVRTAFSSYGLRRTTSDPTARPFIIWALKMRLAQPKCIFHENTRLFPLELLVFMLGDLYKVGWSEILSPWQLGFPVHRPRRITFLHLRGEVIFTGSGADMISRMRCTLQLSGDDLLVAPACVVKEHRERLATRGGKPRAASWADLHTPGRLQRLEQHAANRTQKQGLTGAYLADLDQSPGFTSAGPLVPCLVRHGEIWSFGKARPMMPTEHLIAQGWPMHDVATPEFPATIDPAAHGLAGSDIKKMAGNGMCLPVMGTAFLYSMAHCVVVRRESVCRMFLKGSFSQEHDSDNE